MPKIKAVLFDLDGTLRDTREVIYPALQHALKEHTGQVPSREDMAPYIHHHIEVHKAFGADSNFDDFDATYFSKIEELRTDTRPYAGVNEVVTELYKQGYRLGIVSSANTASDYLNEIGVVQFFEIIVNGADTSEHKPHPEPMCLALQRLGLDASEVVMVGDLPADIEAAQAANLASVIGVTHGFGTRTALEDAGADYIIDSIGELPAILHTIEQKRG